jgi:hypothetical protein
MKVDYCFMCDFNEVAISLPLINKRLNEQPPGLNGWILQK